MKERTLNDMNMYSVRCRYSSGGVLDGTAAQIRASAHSICVNKSRTNSTVIMLPHPRLDICSRAPGPWRAATETITHCGALRRLPLRPAAFVIISSL